ncbi:MAG: CNNM domain-containing protein [Elusimicrobiota bacterium]
MAWVLVLALLIAANAFFVLIEYALVRARPSRLEILSRKNDPRAKLAKEMQSGIEYYLAAVQAGLTLVALALGWIGEPALAGWVHARLPAAFLRARPGLAADASFAAALVILAWALSVFGELLPRSAALQKPESAALLGAYPLKLFATALRPLVSFMSFCSRFFLRLLGLNASAQADSSLSFEEMRILMGETQEKGALAFEQLLLLENLFDFSAAKAHEAMVVRDQIATLSLKKSWTENLAVIRSRRFSRYPLCEDDLDSALGLIHVKDIFLALGSGGAPPDLRLLRRDITRVQSVEPLEKLVKIFPDKGIHMALVEDGQKRTLGLITLEDIVEELIGEVHDEFDLPRAWSLMDLVHPKAVATHLRASGRKAAIEQLVRMACGAYSDLDFSQALRSVWEREERFSSALGRGVAVPHARLPYIRNAAVAIGRFAEPVDFGAPDKGPVRLVFLTLTPSSQPVLQLKIMARIASLASNENLRRGLLRVPNAQSLFEMLRTADTMLAV